MASDVGKECESFWVEMLGPLSTLLSTTICKGGYIEVSELPDLSPDSRS